MMNKVVICGINTSKLPTLTNDEKKALFVRIKSGDLTARDEFVNGNLRLVLSVVRRFANRGENPDDLFQVGCVGLIKSIDNFNVDLGLRFSTYAVPMILGEIRRYLRDNNSIRVSRSLKDIAYKALSARERLSASLGREVTIEEIAKEIEVRKEDVVLSLEAITDPVSLSEPVYHDGSDAVFIMDQVKDPKDNDELWVEDITLKDAIKRIPPRERHIIDLRFFQGKTQMEVANEIGISQAQVSRLEKGALSRLRKQI